MARKIPWGFSEGPGFLPNSPGLPPIPTGDSPPAWESPFVPDGGIVVVDDSPRISTSIQRVLSSVSRRGGGYTISGYPTIPDPLAPIGEVAVTPKPSDALPTGTTTRGYANLDASPLCALLDEPYRSICLFGNTALGGTATVPQQFNPQVGLTGGATGCPQGHVLDSAGRCVKTGVDRYLPGDYEGDDVAWNPVAGRYGVGTRAVLVQRSQLVCPPGFKLGKDNVCYQHLGHSSRKWNPGTRPLLTGGEVHAMQKARSVEKRLKKYATKHLPKACRCSTKRGKK